MKDIDSLRTRSQIDHAKGPCGIPYTYFIDSSTDGLHGLPVRRLEATLHKIQIESGIPSRFVRKAFKSSWLEPTKCSGLRVTSIPYNIQILV
jgi:hypothetical protein